MAPNSPLAQFDTTVTPPSVDSNATIPIVDKTSLNDDGLVGMAMGTQEAVSIKRLKAAFRRFKKSKKRGAGLIVTRYTRHGKAVY